MSGLELQQPKGTQANRANLVRICRDALRTNNPEALAQLRSHAKAIMESLGEEEIQDALTIGLDEQVPAARIADVYLALSAAEPFPSLSDETRDQLIQTNMTREAEIGRAFKEDLLSDLDRALKPLTLIFAEAPTVSETEQRHLRQNPSVAPAWPESAGLLACGLTPLAVLAATASVFPLATRLKTGASQILNNADPVVLCYVWRKAPPKQWERFSQSIVREVLQVAHCREATAKILIDWLIDVARVKPWIFRGAEAVPHECGVELVENQDYADTPLNEIWHKTAETLAPLRQPASAAVAQLA
jgi:hypothetical protein